MRSYRNEALNFYIDRLEAFCHSALPESIDPPRLFGQGPEKKGDIPAPAPRSMPAQPPPAEKLYEFEIRSVPSGKDVLVRGQKRGITPMRLKVAKTDFAHVRIAAPTEQVPVPLSDGKTLYEINLVKKAPPPATPAPEDEILEFCADHYSVEAGGLVTLQWEVRGTGALRIDPLGPVAERKGTRQISVRDTTQYTLTLGEKSRSLIIHIQSRKEAPATVPEAAKRKASNRMLILLGLVMILGLAGYLIAAQFVRSRQERPSASPQIIPQEAKAQPRFSEARVSAFLNDLYTAYNQRDLASILHHYADTVRSYYEAGSLSGDSLMHVLNSLFISPEEYSCVPDLNTLELEPGKTECTVTLLLRETLRPGKEDKAKQYNTRIRYRIDSSYHIVAEGKATP